ncbi:MAG: ATP-binding protein [Acidimicrobiales bacterium]
MSDNEGFQVGIEFDSVLAAISKQIYETPLAFIRENVQNAIDAVRMQAARDSLASSDPSLNVHVTAEDNVCVITDNGIGMSLDDLQRLFWTIGASGKRTEEARAAGCVGMFGIGGFANFGVCDELTVTSQAATESVGHWTKLSRTDIEGANGAIPRVSHGVDSAAEPRGTIVRGVLKEPVDARAMSAFVQDFVQYAEEHVYFNGELISCRPFQLPSESERELSPITPPDTRWTHGNVELTGCLFETPGHLIQAEVREMTIAGVGVRVRGWLRFENGPIAVLKRGFKICSTTIGTDIGVSGVIDCDRLSPTAGRDSLDPESNALLSSIVTSMEHAAILAVLESPDRISQHARVFRYIRRQRMIDQLGNVVVELADGSETRLGEIKRKAEGDIRVFFATSKNRALSQLLQTRGHMVVQLPGDHEKQAAIREYLATYCKAEPFDGRIECAEQYETLSVFERVFLSEVEQTITGSYDVMDLSLVAGRLTEDVPVFAAESTSRKLTVYVDVRHPEVKKLDQLGIGGIFYSLVAAFVREYLGTVLRGRSPKFFGSGAVNLDFLAKRKSELWVLSTGDVEVLRRGTQREVVTQSDVHVIRVGGGGGSGSSASGGVPADQQPREGRIPKLVRIEGVDEFAALTGYYLRIPKTATEAYGDVIQQCEGRGAVWAGNKVMLIASDLISTSFQFEVRLDQLITTVGADGPVAGGAVEIAQPLQGLFDGLYFPLPDELEPYLVPVGNREVRIEVRCDWIDFTSARAWEPATQSATG